MKKTLVTLLVLTFAVFAFACGGETPNANSNKPANTNKPATPAPTVATTPVNANVPPANGANGNSKMSSVPQGKTVDDKEKSKADAVKSAPAPPAPATPKKP